MSKADNEHDQKQEHESSVYEFSSVFLPLKMTQTVLKNPRGGTGSASQRPAPRL